MLRDQHLEAVPERVPDLTLDPEADRKRDQKFWIALGLFAMLAVLIWFTFGVGTVLTFGRRIELRLIPLVIIGTFAFRTVMAHQADKIRRSSRQSR